MADNQSQSDKFKALARELECDEEEAAFDEKLKRVAKQPQSERDEQAPKPDPKAP